MKTMNNRLVSLVLVGSCALLPALAVAGDNPKDPIDGFNRAMFSVNEGIDTVVAKPLANAYDVAAPLPVKAAVGNMFGNVADLFIGVNNGLQGKPSDGLSDIARLLINSTVGIFGLFDVASEMGFTKNEEDFGQTFARWGASDGAYVYLPIFGPRTVRDTVGLVVDVAADPVSNVDHVPTRNSLLALRIVDIRADLLPADKVIEEAALDKYSYIRDAYLQRRLAQRYDGRPPKTQD